MKTEDERQAEFNAVLIGEDELGVVVRAHIYIEHELIIFIESQLPVPSALKGFNLDYAGRLQLALALGLKTSLKAPLNAIGTLRNAFAHRLGKTIEKDDAKSLYSSFDGKGKNILQQAYNNTHQQLNTKNTTKFSNLSPRDQCILCIINLWSSIISEQARLKRDH